MSSTQWRGDGLNNPDDDRGWNLIFEIPFASLGLSSPPTQNTAWRLGITVHDRDYLDGKINWFDIHGLIPSNQIPIMAGVKWLLD